MRHLNLTKRLFWIIAFLVLLSNSLVTLYLYHKFETLSQNRAYSKAKTLQEYFVSMRYVYHKQFLSSGLDLNDSTIGFLPAHASSHISDEFKKHSTQNISIRNVSDNPRNEDNRADALEKQAIDYFTAHPNENDKMDIIKSPGKDFYFFAAPLRIEAYCLACHGKKSEVLPYIAKRYTNAYNYKLNDVRGITSIKIPVSLIFNEIIATFWQEIFFSWMVILCLLIIMYIAIKELTKNDVKQKKALEEAVEERTVKLEHKSIELEHAYEHQKHLYSILRTVADSNQILITSQTLNALLEKTALCLYSNDSFSHVKISLVQNNALHVIESYGFEEDKKEVNELEVYVFEHNTTLKFTEITPHMPESCKEKFIQRGITELYVTGLTSDKFSKSILGVLSVSTFLPGGFSQEERDMLEELAGDIGFAINSFLQKEDIIKLSYYDPLTKLANRTMLTEHVRMAIVAAKEKKSFGALLFMDLDNFKSINDLKGHSAGDTLLVLMAERLVRFSSQNSFIARFGGDEFAYLLPFAGNNSQEAVQNAETVAMQITVLLKEPFVLDNHPFYLTISIGISILNGTEQADTLLSRADSAMYAAKDAGKNTICFFDENIQKTMEEKSFLLHELRDAIDLQQFKLYYQKQVDSKGEPIGVEALVRWIHPQKGLVSPLSFIPLCEESGLMIPLGSWVINQAIAQAKIWQGDSEKAHWRISINVSVKQFAHENFVPFVKETLMHYGVKPQRICLEITESVLIGDIKLTLAKIMQLKDMGITFSIDDFGTGYSSLQYMKQLSLDELKIDQSFIRDLLVHKSDASIVETMLSIGQKLGIIVIAEGVETQEQFECLKAMGCLYFQGYLFSKPTTVEML
ncbi:MAG: EAL domain-containing protein [Sulfurospirillaceae bacterium]|nr:EAL domain-containing protein [Sulfurospirillaceae bacterium]MDD2825866.1 EAL domain-containing protein [Sulfurospirillaceae bacterium]